MKALLVMSLMVLTSLVSHAREMESSLLGKWELVGRSCSSGQEPFDNFVVGRDVYKLELGERHFRSFTRIGYCDQWVQGFYRADRDALHFYVQNGGSTCGMQLPREFHYLYRVGQHEMVITMGPFVGGPASCGYGEYLRSVLTRQTPGGDLPPEQGEEPQPEHRPKFPPRGPQQ